MGVSTHNKIASDICDVLGLKHVRHLELIMDTKAVITIKAELFPEADVLKDIKEILEDYQAEQFCFYQKDKGKQHRENSAGFEYDIDVLSIPKNGYRVLNERKIQSIHDRERREPWK